MPDSSALEKIDFFGETVDLVLLLETMNQRLEVLLDREHTIGHAYFYEDGSMVDSKGLVRVFKDKILPQLADYFFEDWEKIRQVLGDTQVKDESLQFVRKRSISRSLFGNDISTDSLKSTYVINEAALTNPAAYTKIYSAVNSGSED